MAAKSTRRVRRPPGRGPVAGVDEAGRGPVLGPLVVAGVRADRPGVLRDLGVADSKRLTPTRREELYPAITEVASVSVRLIPHDELDRRMGGETLNTIEVAAFADVLRELDVRRAVVDACDVNADRFGLRVGAALGVECAILSEHKADDHHPEVAAASIVAKVLRDREMQAIAARLGETVGSGYSHDPVTRRFLSTWVKREGALPPYARARWATASRLMNRTLDDFGAPSAAPSEVAAEAVAPATRGVRE